MDEFDEMADEQLLVRARDISPEDVALQPGDAPVGRVVGPAPLRLMSLKDLLALPPKEWLIHEMLQDGDLAVAYGPSGEGKTFVALDMALCVATGTFWHGHAVRSGPVIYIAAEGSRGIRNRVRAWAGEQLQDVTSPLHTRFYCVPEAVQLRTELDRLIDAVRHLDPKPKLIVVDTLARSIVGLEENSATEMGEALHACGELQRATGATVLLIHHTGKGEGKDVERGSSALRAAADSMIIVRRDDADMIHVEVTKQKEAEGGEHVVLKLEHVDLGLSEGSISESSCRLARAHAETQTPSVHPELRPHSLTVCLTLRDSFDAEGASTGMLREACEVPRASFYRAVKEAATLGYIEKPDKGRQARYVLLPKFQWPAVS
jgi:hypothetical protein